VTNYIALAIPVFMVSIGIEAAVGRARRRQVMRLGDMAANLGCGITQQVGLFFVHGALIAGYTWVWERHGTKLPSTSLLTWALCFLAVDFVYYWWHRLSHEISVLWASHVTHHQSEDYNLAVALRQAVLSDFTIWPMHLALAVAGFPPLVFATLHSFSTLYQFWIHTELIGKLGPLEWVLNTPSHHRVHHAVNEPYLDKNYAATLMIWDQLFGTFVRETEAPRYGVTTPLNSFNPLWAQVEHVATLWRRTRLAPSFGEAVKVWLKSPAWHPSWLPESPHGDGRKYDPLIQRPVAIRLLVDITLASLGTFVLLMWGEAMGWPARVALAVATVLSAATIAASVEKKRWRQLAEIGRGVALLTLGVAIAAR
jgi:sterol desaturase/sphingolipid hydroxylase (fatty acid hydroxylase superfamily)